MRRNSESRGGATHLVVKRVHGVMGRLEWLVVAVVVAAAVTATMTGADLKPGM